MVAEHGYDPHTSGLWAQRASTVILCELVSSTSDQLVDHQQKPLTVILEL